jgi:hypothetical protein
VARFAFVVGFAFADAVFTPFGPFFANGYFTPFADLGLEVFGAGFAAGVVFFATGGFATGFATGFGAAALPDESCFNVCGLCCFASALASRANVTEINERTAIARVATTIRRQRKARDVGIG